jgi:4-hydroxybenzoate polyprenyltransferase
MAPMLFMYFILSPISGLPILLEKQKLAFLISLSGYAFTLVTLFIGLWFDLSFLNTLYLYGFVYGLFYLTLLIWYYQLIKKRNESIN